MNDTKMHRVEFDFSSYMDSLELADITIKSVKTGKHICVPKCRLRKVSIKSSTELLSFYPGMSASTSDCKGIQGMLSEATMKELKEVAYGQY